VDRACSTAFFADRVFVLDERRFPTHVLLLVERVLNSSHLVADEGIAVVQEDVVGFHLQLAEACNSPVEHSGAVKIDCVRSCWR